MKVRISLTLFALLATGMLLVNVVVTAFWQRDLLATQVNMEKRNLRILGTMLQQIGSTASLNNFMEIQHLAGERFINIATYDKHSMLFAGDFDKKKLGEVIMMAATSHGDIVQVFFADRNMFSPEQYYVRIAVFLNPGKVVGVVIRLNSVYHIMDENQRIILVYILVNSIFLTVIGLFRMAALVIRPIEKLVKLSETYSVNEKDFFFPSKSKNEFGVLASSLNCLLNKIEADRKNLKNLIDSLEISNEKLRTTQNEMILSEKMAAIGLLSAGIAHEIGNPLSIVQGYIELLADRSLSDEETSLFSEKALHELDRVSTLIRKLLNHARTSSTDIVPALLTEILWESIEAVKAQKHDKEILFETNFQLDKEIVISDSLGLRQVLLNCLFNSLDAIRNKEDQDDNRIVVACSIDSQKHESEKVLITISDNGIGMTETERMSAFDPFFTTKIQGRGTGLGLFVSYANIEAMKGRIWIESSPGTGTVVYIEFMAAMKLPENNR